ncbi:MAG: hypothetical protein KatS3mg007_2329 [Thermoanaerobaculum sp.]|nr:MAG: hypothetical protein KatS3mg007_2329 [Thermoanaerobaculum sp.]
MVRSENTNNVRIAMGHSEKPRQGTFNQPKVVRILLSEVQVAEMKLAQVRLEVVRFSGSQEHGPAILLRGEGSVTVAGKEDRVLLLADTASRFSGQWRKLSRGEVMQVPVKLAVQGETLSGALVVWEREGQRQGRFVVDESDGGAQRRFTARSLAAPAPNLPSSESIVDFYADPYFTEWVGTFIRLCSGATLRDGIQDGFARAEEATACADGSQTKSCFVATSCEDSDGDGVVSPDQCTWIGVACPCHIWSYEGCAPCPPICPWLDR